MTEPTCEDVTNDFTYKVNMICYNESEETLDVIIFVLNCVLFFLLVKILFQSEKYIKKIVTPSKFVFSYRETYCVISVLIVRCCQLSILIAMWSCVFNAFTCIIGTKYREWFLNDAFK